MSTCRLTTPTRAAHTQAASESPDARTDARTDARADAQSAAAPAPNQGGVLAGLKSRAAAIGDSLPTPRRPNVPTDLSALSLLRVGTRGRPVLPHQRNEVRKPVALPPVALPASADAESVAAGAAVPIGDAMRKPQRELERALGGFNAATHTQSAAALTAPASDTLMAVAQRRFTSENPKAIAALVDAVRDALPPESMASNEARAAQAELLLDALAETTSGMAALSQRVLQRMQQGLRFEPVLPEEASLTDRSTKLAWRTAQHLASTASGYDCARALAGATWPDPGHGPARYAPRVWLRAAGELVNASGCDADPRSVLRHASQRAGNDDATTAAHAAWIVRAASRLWETGSAEGLNASEKGALLAGRHDYFANGPGTQFAAVTNRIARFVNHTIARAASDRPALEPADGEAPVSVASRRTFGAALVRPFGFRKTALASLGGGVPGASLGAWDKDQAALDDAVRGALVALHEGLAAGPARDGAAARPRKLLSDRAALTTIVGRAELDVLAQRAQAPGAARIQYGMTLDDATLDQIAARAARSLDDTTIARIAQQRNDADSVHGAMRERRVRQTLQRFRDALAAGDGDPAARARARKLVRKHLANGSNVVDAAKFDVWKRWLGDSRADVAARHFDTIDRVALGQAITPRGTTIADFREAGARIIDALEGGGKAIVTDGGQFGASTRGITATAASFPLLAPRLNLQAARGRQSVLEISRSTAAYKIGFGTQRRTRYEAGGGVPLGHNFGVARVGGNLEGGYQWDDTEQCTVDMSIARRLKHDDDAYDEKTAKTQLKRINDYLFDNAGKGKSARALWNELGERFYDSDDFSIAWNDQTGQLRRAEVTANVRAGVKIGSGKFSARANAMAGGVYQYVPRATLSAADSSGQTQIESHRFGSGHRAGVQLGISGTLSGTTQKSGSVDGGDLATVSMLTPNVIGIEIPLHDSFHQAKVTLVRERGVLQTRASNADIEFADFAQYKQALREDPAWRLAFGLASGDALPATQAALDSALDAGAKKIERYLSTLSANQVQNLKFVLRRRLRSHAARDCDVLGDRIASLEKRNRASDADEITSLRAQRDALLKRADSWLPTELLAIQANDRQISAGLRMGVQIAVQKGARGEHEVTSLKLKPREADRIDEMWPRAVAR